MTDVDRPHQHIMRFRCSFGIGEAIGNAVVWVLLACITAGLALLIFPYFFNRSVLNRTEVLDAGGRAIGRLNCRLNVSSSVGHFILWVILILVTLGLASFVYAYRVLRVVLNETEIVFY
jgi:cytochrome bd-type quinol oxidase subunit 2